MGAEWQHGLCGCFDNFGVCIISYFVPCYTFGKNAETVGENCLLYGLLSLFPLLNCICGATIRGKVRDSKGIEGGFVGDCLAMMFCGLCVIVQIAQEQNSIGGAMAVERVQTMERE